MKRFLKRIEAARCTGLVLQWLAYVLVALQLLGLFLFLPGCGGTKSVVVPAQETAENWQTDTLRLPAPPQLKPPGTGRVALPARVEEHAPIPAPAPFDVTEIELNAETLTVRSPTVTRRFAAPAAGETLRVRREASTPGVRRERRPGAPCGPSAGSPWPDSAGAAAPVTGRVDGRPQPDTIRTEPQEETEEEAGVFEKLAGLPAWGLVLLIVVVAAVLIFFFRIFTRR